VNKFQQKKQHHQQCETVTQNYLLITNIFSAISYHIISYRCWRCRLWSLHDHLFI